MAFYWLGWIHISKRERKAYSAFELEILILHEEAHHLQFKANPLSFVNNNHSRQGKEQQELEAELYAIKVFNKRHPEVSIDELFNLSVSALLFRKYGLPVVMYKNKLNELIKKDGDLI